MADHPDHQERPPPFENVITDLPANVAAYRSTAVHVDNSGGAVATVRVTWHMQDAPAVSTWEEKTVAAGAATTLFFVNQGDTLESVTLTGGGGGTTHAVSESNQLPLPSSPAAAVGGGGGIQFDVVPQTGGFLDVRTNGVGGGGPGAGTGIFIYASGAVGDLVLSFDRYLIFAGVPTVDPGVYSAIWADAGTLKISGY